MNSPEKRDLIDEYWNIKLYSPLQYVPQAIGVTAGRLISDNIVVIGMCGRVTGYIFWLALCTYAIKLMPNKKVFLMILCLLPINIFSAIAISGDTVTNAVCMLFIAMIYRKMYLEEKINKKEKIILILTACMLALCKIVYLPFVTLVFMLKEPNFESKKELRRFCILLIIASVIVGLAWFVVGSSNLATSNEASPIQTTSFDSHTTNIMENSSPIPQANIMNSTENLNNEPNICNTNSTGGMGKAFNIGKEVMNMGMYMAEGKNFKNNNYENNRVYNRQNINDTRKEDIQEKTNKIITLEEENLNE